MRFASYLSFFLIVIILISSGCSTVEVSKADGLQTPMPILQKKPLNELDLTTIKYISHDRAQDGSLQDADFNKLSIGDDLIAHGKDSIQFLISKLEDETELNRQVINYWYKVYVGDVALIILTDFFTNDGLTSTIQGFAWDEFLERGNDKDSMGEEILRNYIKKHGRTKIKERWQKIWDENKENIFWDETERCFKLRK